eukprot:TRINITY_DN5788_c0_g2_i1.p1 TRINITY_DN5788_c0_g2~~TRINITY_DN5788_c0_g2_i1.p1  ORF type:complete len:225 (-),score=28.35 TRINITY_DN5788_c0_g2_i1:338-1012(-)
MHNYIGGMVALDPRTFVTSSTVDFALWDATTAHHIYRERTKKYNSKIAKIDENTVVATCMTKMVNIWDARSGKIVRELKGHTKKHGQSVAVLADGHTILTTAGEFSVHVWDLRGQQDVATKILRKHDSPVVALCDCGKKRFASATILGTVRITSPETGLNLHEVVRDKKAKRTFSLAKISEQHFASAGKNKIVSVWDADTGTAALRWKAHSGTINDCIALYSEA